MIDIPCILFAGGKSSRMGEDKALLPFAKYSTLAEYQYSRLSSIFSHVYISCKDSSKFMFDADFIEDIGSLTLYAPTLGFSSSFEKLQAETIFVLSVDTPFVKEEDILKIVAEDKNIYDATIAKTSQTHPLCGIYHRSLQVKFLEMQKSNQHKLGLLLRNSSVKYVVFENEDTFLNLNTPDEYQKALTLI